MKEPVHLIVLVLGIVLFFLGAVLPPPQVEPWRIRIVSAGLFCVWLSTLITA